MRSTIALFKYAVVYLDNILLLSRNFSKHLSQLKMVFDKLIQANLCVNDNNCKFTIAEVKYILGLRNFYV